jgi:hypothetical protein
LSRDGLAAAAIAARLEADGYRSARPDRRRGVSTVRLLQRRLGLRTLRPRTLPREGLGPDEWWASDLAAALGMTRGTLETWLRRGWVTAHQRDEPLRRWVVHADAAELARLRDRRRSLRAAAQRRWTAGAAVGAVAGEEVGHG